MIALVGHEEHGVDAGCEAPVHVRELELVLEVGEGAQAADDDGRAVARAELDEQAVELGELEACAVMRKRVLDELDALGGGEQRLLALVGRDGDDHAIGDLERALEDVDVSVRDRIEGSGVDGDRGFRHHTLGGL